MESKLIRGGQNFPAKQISFKDFFQRLFNFSSRIIWPFLAAANLNGSSSVSWKDHQLLRAGGQPERAQLAERPRVFPGRQAEQLLAAVRKRENVDLIPGKRDNIAWWFNFFFLSKYLEFIHQHR